MVSHPVKSRMDTLEISPADVQQWRIPLFQRPIRQNAKVMQMAQAIQMNGAVIDGIVTLGHVKGDKSTYIVDGQHRLEAMKISGVPKAYVDVRECEFESMAHMADEFVKLNSALVRMRPDDILRGLIPSVPNLRKILDDCPFIGCDHIRRSAKGSPILGLSVTIRCWFTSANETPAPTGLQSAPDLALSLTEQSTEDLLRFLACAYSAWGRDQEFLRLWSTLNLTLCMWLFRRLVLDTERKGKRYIVLNYKQFKACLASLAANENYVEFLHGRGLSELNRSPTYKRIRDLWSRRLRDEGVHTKINFPSPTWYKSA